MTLQQTKEAEAQAACSFVFLRPKRVLQELSFPRGPVSVSHLRLQGSMVHNSREAWQ